MPRSPVYYSSTTSTPKEIDLRAELQGTLFGAFDEIAKGRVGLYREMRRDDSDKRVVCECKKNVSDEAEKDFLCRPCHGMGFLWDEYRIVYYKDESSRTPAGELNFYIKYSEELRDEDYIVQVKLDVDGNPAAPVQREYLYKILKAEAFRSDN